MLLAALEAAGETRTIDGRAYWATTDFPAAKVNLRTISDDTYTIMDRSASNAVIGTVDAISALELVYPEAIYLHEGETWYVRALDLEQKTGVRRAARRSTTTRSPCSTRTSACARSSSASDWRGESVRFGEVTYSWQTIAMKKVRFHSLDAIGYHPLELPRLTLDTAGFWFAPAEEAWRAVARLGLNPMEGLSGARNLFLTLLSMLSMCDPADLGGVIDSSNLGRPGLFVFDRYPGGLGFAEQGYARLDELAARGARALGRVRVRDGLPVVRGIAHAQARAAAGPRSRPRPRGARQGRGTRAARALAGILDVTPERTR